MCHFCLSKDETVHLACFSCIQESQAHSELLLSIGYDQLSWKTQVPLPLDSYTSTFCYILERHVWNDPQREIPFGWQLLRNRISAAVH